MEIQKKPHAPVEYMSIETGGSRGSMLKRPADTPPPECGTNTYVCSIVVDDFDETAEAILENSDGKFPVPGVCWQGYFYRYRGKYIRII